MSVSQVFGEYASCTHATLQIRRRCRSPELVVDPETFALKMQKIVLDVKGQTFSLGKIRISDVLSSVLQNVRAHHVKMEADFVNT